MIYQGWLELQLGILRGFKQLGNKEADGSLAALISKFEKESARLAAMEQLAWQKEMVKAGLLKMGPSGVRTPKKGPRGACLIVHRHLHLLITMIAPNSAVNASKYPSFIVAALVTVTILHSVAAVSRPYGHFILATLRVVLFGAFAYQTNPIARYVLTAAQVLLLKAIPIDVRAAMRLLRVQADIVQYATCSSCCATYAPDPDKPDDPYPHACTHSEMDNPVCGTPLVYATQVSDGKTSRTVYKPIKIYPYRSLVGYLAALLMKPGVEGWLEKCWEIVESDGHWRDIMDAPAIREFCGPDGRTPFSVQKNGELHLVFSLYIDWFNPHSNKKGGKSHSIGAIYLACLGLPPHLRFRPEYMCLVGVIPGPKEPSLTDINHFLRPLVDELLEFWHRGVFFPETAERTTFGRVVRAVVIPLVCDLPALRKTSGFAGHSSRHFCSFCPLPKDDMSNPDRSEWPKGKTWEEHLRFAREWRDAPTKAARKALFDRHGLRWSELLRLDYWDPTKYALIDTMHNLFLGTLRHHCMDVWGIAGVGETDGTGNAKPHTPTEQQVQIDRVITGLKQHSPTALDRMRRDYLVAFAELNGVVERRTKAIKKVIIDALLDYVRSSLLNPRLRLNIPQVKPMTEIEIDAQVRKPIPLQESTARFHLPDEQLDEDDVFRFHLFSSEVLRAVRRDISQTIVPTWIEKPPANFGEASHGKLKADQWRTLCTIYMPLTLVCLWGQAGASDAERTVLENFVQLATAADLATRRSMFPERAETFDKNMEAYVKGLRSIYKHHLVPNHHVALHLKPYLLMFGPVHGWWAFPFERTNGLLQRLNTNYKSRASFHAWFRPSNTNRLHKWRCQ